MTTSAEIAIIGIGIHPFGRHPDRSALEMGAIVISRALRDAGVERDTGVEWDRIGTVYAGSLEVANPEAVTLLAGQVPNDPTVALTQLDGAPGSAAGAILSR